MMEIAFTAKLSVAEDILVRELEGESVILNLNNESYYGLDEVGTRMWTALTSSDSIQEAYEALLEEYEVEDTVLRRDLQEMIEKLVEKGMLEVDNGEADKI